MFIECLLCTWYIFWPINYSEQNIMDFSLSCQTAFTWIGGWCAHCEFFLFFFGLENERNNLTKVWNRNPFAKVFLHFKASSHENLYQPFLFSSAALTSEIIRKWRWGKWQKEENLLMQTCWELLNDDLKSFKATKSSFLGVTTLGPS